MDDESRDLLNEVVVEAMFKDALHYALPSNLAQMALALNEEGIEEIGFHVKGMPPMRIAVKTARGLIAVELKRRFAKSEAGKGGGT